MTKRLVILTLTVLMLIGKSAAGYKKSVGGCRSLDGNNNAGEKLYTDSACAERCDNDATCTGLIVDRTSCATYHAPVVGDGHSTQTCYVKLVEGVNCGELWRGVCAGPEGRTVLIGYGSHAATSVADCRAQCKQVTDCEVVIIRNADFSCNFFRKEAVDVCIKNTHSVTIYKTYSVNECVGEPVTVPETEPEVEPEVEVSPQQTTVSCKIGKPCKVKFSVTVKSGDKLPRRSASICELYNGKTAYCKSAKAKKGVLSRTATKKFNALYFGRAYVAVVKYKGEEYVSEETILQK